MSVKIVLLGIITTVHATTFTCPPSFNSTTVNDPDWEASAEKTSLNALNDEACGVPTASFTRMGYTKEKGTANNCAVYCGACETDVCAPAGSFSTKTLLKPCVDPDKCTMCWSDQTECASYIELYDAAAKAALAPAPAPAPDSGSGSGSSSTAGQVIPGLVMALSMLALGMFAAIECRHGD
jgi:hypothetical protein